MLRLRLSGGPHRQKFEDFANKEEAKKYICAQVGNRVTLEFVEGQTKADYIVVPNHVWAASKTASASGGRAYRLNDFINYCRRC